jgi:hypothetical protein
LVRGKRWRPSLAEFLWRLLAGERVARGAAPFEDKSEETNWGAHGGALFRAKEEWKQGSCRGEGSQVVCCQIRQPPDCTEGLRPPFSRTSSNLSPHLATIQFHCQASLLAGKANSTCLAIFFHAPASHSSLISFFFANVLSFSFQGNLPHLRATPIRQGLFP